MPSRKAAASEDFKRCRFYSRPGEFPEAVNRWLRDEPYFRDSLCLNYSELAACVLQSESAVAALWPPQFSPSFCSATMPVVHMEEALALLRLPRDSRGT